MRRAAILYNPHSGRSRGRLRSIEAAASALRSNSVDVTICPTDAPGSAGTQALHLAAAHDTIFAAGGDGTIHDVAQGLAFHPSATLAILPVGTANALARHLNLALNPAQAALQQLAYVPRTIPVGKVTFTTPNGESSRYFLVMAGAGPDGALIYNMLASSKSRLGRAVYYIRAASLFLTGRFSSFAVELSTAAGQPQSTTAVSAMVLRVGDLGGLFSPLVRGAGLEDPSLLLTLANPPARFSLPLWFSMSWLGRRPSNRFVGSHLVQSFACGPGQSHPVQVEADGEWLGRTPMSVTLVPSALRLLLPPEI
jgi:diacylglycerol kinase (ATP)